MNRPVCVSTGPFFKVSYRVATYSIERDPAALVIFSFSIVTARAEPKFRPNIMTKKQKAIKLVRIAVLEEQDYKCARSGETRGVLGDGIEVHHIGGRNNTTLYTTLGQIGLTDEHHRGNDDAPHINQQKFLEWLQTNYPIKYRYYMENRNKIVADRDVDLDAIIEAMEAQVNVVV